MLLLARHSGVTNAKAVDAADGLWLAGFLLLVLYMGYTIVVRVTVTVIAALPHWQAVLFNLLSCSLHFGPSLHALLL